MSDQSRRWLKLGERSIRTGAYWMIAVAGLASLVRTPVTIQAALGSTMVTVWGVFLLAGGLAAAIAATAERWLYELPAIPIVITGLGLYLVALWSITIDGEITRLTQTSLITGYALHLVARGVQLFALKRAVTVS